MGYRTVNLQADYAAVVSLIESTGDTNLRHIVCIEELQRLLARNWRDHVSHTYREGNRVVTDLLAHQSHSLPFEVHHITCFSSDIS
ncbi:hypothetical protein LINGRAHAP2_LOCUS35587 [Linum grandiflorum]